MWGLKLQAKLGRGKALSAKLVIPWKCFCKHARVRTLTEVLKLRFIFCCWSPTEQNVKSPQQSVWCWEQTADLLTYHILFRRHPAWEWTLVMKNISPPTKKALIQYQWRHWIPPKKAHLCFFLDVFPLKVSNLFHSQTLSNWIVNLWWQLFIRPAPEMLMSNYFSLMTSPQITSGDSGPQVWTVVSVLQLLEEISSHFDVFPGGPSPFQVCSTKDKTNKSQICFSSICLSAFSQIWSLTAPWNEKWTCCCKTSSLLQTCFNASQRWGGLK